MKKLKPYERRVSKAVQNCCAVCGHFIHLHNGKGCDVQFCDCKLRVKQTEKGRRVHGKR